MAQLIADDIYKKTGCENQIKILSRIGKPIDQPFVCFVLISDLSKEKEARDIADNWMSNVKKVTDLIINEKARLY